MPTSRTRSAQAPATQPEPVLPGGLRLAVYRADGGVGRYVQDDAGRAAMAARRLDPATMFRSGPIVIGTLNPFTLLNPDQVCWIEAESTLALPRALPPGVDSLRKLGSRAEYENILARQWPRWRRDHPATRLLEALVELSFKGGATLHLHVTGEVTDAPLTELIFGGNAITASLDSGGLAYVNPACIVRARVYHSLKEVDYPAGLWCMEADDI